MPAQQRFADFKQRPLASVQPPSRSAMSRQLGLPDTDAPATSFDAQAARLRQQVRNLVMMARLIP